MPSTGSCGPVFYTKRYLWLSCLFFLDLAHIWADVWIKNDLVRRQVTGNYQKDMKIETRKQLLEVIISVALGYGINQVPCLSVGGNVVDDGHRTGALIRSQDIS